mgnify:CR=1 FL=1
MLDRARRGVTIHDSTTVDTYAGHMCILVSIIVDKYAGCRQDNSELR